MMNVCLAGNGEQYVCLYDGVMPLAFFCIYIPEGTDAEEHEICIH